jgi:hypothetical protein
MDKSKLYSLGTKVRDELLKKNGHFTVREFKRSMNLCLYKAMTPELRTRYMVSFLLNACAIYSMDTPKDLPEVNMDLPIFEDGTASFEEAIFEIKKVMYERSPKEQNFDVGTVLAILSRLDKQYGWGLYESAKRYGK